MIKTMKNKSCIVALLAIFTLGLTTSCEDMFDVESNRVVYNHEINSTSDSVYTTLGVLQSMRKVADRYVVLGEVRGDMVEINENTKTSLRNLSNFDFDADNEYLNVRDYYAIINNCNYALAKMDTTLAINNQRVMTDEYVALLGIRAWTYLQLAINYEEVPYYTYPIVTETDVEKAKAEGKKDIKAIADNLIPQLIPYVDYELPSFVNTQGSYPILRLVLADLYLWSKDYANAVECYEDFFMKNKKFAYSATDDNGTVLQSGYMSLGGKFMSWKGSEKSEPAEVDKSEGYNSQERNAKGYENLAYIRMEASADKGLASELGSLFSSSTGTPYLSVSYAWKALGDEQTIFYLEEGKNAGDKPTMKTSQRIGDMREDRYTSTVYMASDFGDELVERFTKFSTYQEQINIYRRSIALLRWAEALNALAKEQWEVAVDSAQMAEARNNAVDAFYLLKDASKVFFPDSSDVQKKFGRFSKELKSTFVGVHARGTGDVAYDTEYYVLDSAVIAKRLGMTEPKEEFNLVDTIRYVDELIIDELALESTCEGNRFGDLIRFAKRRQAWGEGDYVDFLAKRVANRGEEEDEELYNKLIDEEYWYLPFK